MGRISKGSTSIYIYILIEYVLRAMKLATVAKYMTVLGSVGTGDLRSIPS